MQKKKMKRAVTALLTAILTVTSAVPVLAKEQPTWTIGYDTNTNGPGEGVQGENGWYFMYSDEVNTDGKLDPSRLKECNWESTGSCWFFYEKKNYWIPDVYTADGFDVQDTSEWWRMDSNGLMDPNTSKNFLRSVVAWEAPQSGKYSIDMSYVAGSQSMDWEGKTYYFGDGLTLSINTDKDVLDKAFAEAVTAEKPDLPTGNMKAEVQLKKGDKIYFSVDPGENGECDVAKIKAKITQTEAGGFDISSIPMIAWIGIGVVVVVIAVLAGVLLGKKKTKE